MDLMESFAKLVTPNLLSSLSASLGESEAATQKTLGAAVPAVLAGMLGKASDHGAMGMLEGLLRDTSNDGSVLSNLGGLVGAGASTSPMGALGGRLLSGVFGNQLGPLAGVLASLGGVKPTSASSLLSMAAPMLMSLLGSRMRESGMGLAGLLNSQRQSIMAAVPSGLSTILGAVDLPKVERPLVDLPRVAGAPDLHDVPKRGVGWVVPVLAALALGFFAWTMLRPAPLEPAPAATVAPALAPAPASVAPTSVEVVGRSSFPAGGFETRLVGFIEGTSPVDDTTWFDFDRVLFDTGRATIRPESDEQITNTANVLKAFPNVNLKVGGYTDNVGNPVANQKLSQARAEAVMQAIIAKGIEAARLEAEGYGDEHPVADNSTDAGRQQNRRVSVRVTKK